METESLAYTSFWQRFLRVSNSVWDAENEDSIRSHDANPFGPGILLGLIALGIAYLQLAKKKKSKKSKKSKKKPMTTRQVQFIPQSSLCLTPFRWRKEYHSRLPLTNLPHTLSMMRAPSFG